MARSKKKWLWEFSKRLVTALVILYFAGNIVAMVIMAVHKNFDALGTMLDNLTEVMKYCVFGYFVKAGVENAFKIKLNKEE